MTTFSKNLQNATESWRRYRRIPQRRPDQKLFALEKVRSDRVYFNTGYYNCSTVTIRGYGGEWVANIREAATKSSIILSGVRKREGKAGVALRLRWQKVTVRHVSCPAAAVKPASNPSGRPAFHRGSANQAGGSASHPTRCAAMKSRTASFGQ